MPETESICSDRVVSRSFSVVRSAMEILLDALLWLPRFWMARSALCSLQGMTELECRDIGLTGCEIERCLTPRNRLQRRAAPAPDLEDRRFCI
jgi:hypothetical protein